MSFQKSVAYAWRPLLAMAIGALDLLVLLRHLPTWLFAVLTLAMIVTWIVTLRAPESFKHYRSKRSSAWLITVWFIVLHFVFVSAWSVCALIWVETHDRATRVLVCVASPNGHAASENDTLPEDWWIKTPKGEFDLQPGIYSGVFYPSSDKAGGAITPGVVYEITYHGGLFTARFVTEAVPTGETGKCG